MEPLEYTHSASERDSDYLQEVREIESEICNDDFHWDYDTQSRVMNTIEKMKTEIEFFRSSNGFKHSDVDLKSESSMKDSANSFYSAPNFENEKLITENDELRSQIIEIESEVPDFDAYVRSRDEIVTLRELLKEKQNKLAKLKENTQQMRETVKSGNQGVYDYKELQKQVDELQKELNDHEEEEEIKRQEKELEEMRKEASDGQSYADKMRIRAKELENELKENFRKLELMQSGIDPNKKATIRRRNFSPSNYSNNSKRSIPRKNFVASNKRVSSLPNNKRTPSYARPTKQFHNRHQTTSRSPANRFASGNRNNAYSNGRKPGQISKSIGQKSNSGSRKRSNTRPQLPGVFSRLYQSKQRDSPLRTLNNRVSPSYRTGGYKRTSGNRAQRPSPGAQGVKKRSPGTRVTTNFQVSDRLYPGPGGRKSKERVSSKDRLNNSNSRRSNSNSKYKNVYGSYRQHSENRSNSYGRVPRPFNKSNSGSRVSSKERKTRPPISNAVFERLYKATSNSKNTKTNRDKPKKPPAKPSTNNYVNNSSNNDLGVVEEMIGREESKLSGRNRKENNFKAANSSLERRQAAREALRGNKPIIERELVRTKEPTTTYSSNKKDDINDRLKMVENLILKGLEKPDK